MIYTFKADTEQWVLKGDGYSRVGIFFIGFGNGVIDLLFADVYVDSAKNFKVTGVTVSGDNKFEVSYSVFMLLRSFTS